VITRDGGKSWKPTNIKRTTMLTSVCTITREVKANASENYIHRESK
jgi:hypothetical protein